MKRLLPVAALVASSFAIPSGAHAGIMKCKDANGLWHYGDHAAAACTQSRSKVIEFSTKNGTQKVLKGAPTKKELKVEEQEKLAKEAAKKRQAEQARQDKILRDSYATEQDIIFERDRKVKELQDAIDSGESTVKSLQAVLDRTQKRVDDEKSRGKVSRSSQKTLAMAEKQVKEHEAALADKRQELVDLRKKYDGDLKRFREMKHREAAAGSQRAAQP